MSERRHARTRRRRHCGDAVSAECQCRRPVAASGRQGIAGAGPAHRLDRHSARHAGQVTPSVPSLALCPFPFALASPFALCPLALRPPSCFFPPFSTTTRFPSLCVSSPRSLLLFFLVFPFSRFFDSVSCASLFLLFGFRVPFPLLMSHLPDVFFLTLLDLGVTLCSGSLRCSSSAFRVQTLTCKRRP